MDYKQSAKEVYEKIGGKQNLISAAHCATRLRLVIADNDKCDKDAVENIDGVKGVFFASGQLQIIFGTGIVNKVYDEFIAIAGITASTKEEVKAAATAKTNWFQKAIKTLGDIFVPIIPAIVASGFLMGIMESLNFMVNNGIINIDTSSSLYVFAQIFSNTAYTFLPILIAFSAAKVFGGNPFLGAVIGMIMIHPNLQNAWTVATEGVLQTQSVFFGLYSIDMVGYQGHVIPVIIAAWILSTIEKKLHKIVPAMLDLFVTPLVSVFVTAYLTLAAIGPVFVLIENGILDGVQWLIALPLGIGSFIMGTAYATTVVSGIHHMYTVIDLGQISKFGMTYWLPLASAANVAQGSAALAVALKTKNKKLKSMALPSSLSAFMGITEPAIFGVNMRFFKPFVAASIGGGCGALYASIVGLGATGTGVTGIFGILLHLHRPMQYIITLAIAIGVSFVLTWIIWKEETEKKEQKENNQNTQTGQNEQTEQNQTTSENKIVYSPIKGKVIPLNTVKDETFAGEYLGKGVAIQPEQGRVVAPFDGKITVVMDTKHAVGITSNNGIEVLIHVGMDTVQLNGKYYQTHVKVDDEVKKGDLLLTFEKENIIAEGYEITTPVVITNTADFKQINVLTNKQSEEGDEVITLQ
ncbi:MAG: PTS transporter subunit EIIC [Firmicutes bacterium]|jgi:PTS system sucrose-specific IIC component|nr:PTS transporter subunit EIIC [Bacillota bacterium]